jgi:hypothetical protein
MTKQVGVLMLVGALVAGGAVMAVWPSGGDRSSAAPTNATVPVAEAGGPEAIAPAATPMPAAMATGAAEPCDTPAKIEPEAAPIAKFLEAPCAPGEEGKVAPMSGAGAPAASSAGAQP